MSCNFYENRVTFENSSSKKVDSIEVFANPLCKPLTFYDIKSNTKISDELLNCDKEGSDGSYLIKIYCEKKIVEERFGYFTNGVAAFKELTIRFDEEQNINIEEE